MAKILKYEPKIDKQFFSANCRWNNSTVTKLYSTMNAALVFFVIIHIDLNVSDVRCVPVDISLTSSCDVCFSGICKFSGLPVDLWG